MTAWELEKYFETPQKERLFRDFLSKLKQLRLENPDLKRRLSELPRHLKPDLTLRELQNLLLPWERLIEQTPEDGDFLISSQDKGNSKSRPTIPLEIALDHWRSAFNIGSVFRTGDALGIQKIHLLGYTTTPNEKFLHKTALGTENTLPWEHHEHTLDAIGKWKKDGYHVVAFETSSIAKNLENEFPHQKTIFIFGNERFGLSSQTLSLCDETRQLPMSGMKNSLNAAVMMALATYEWKKQWSR